MKNCLLSVYLLFSISCSSHSGNKPKNAEAADSAAKQSVAYVADDFKTGVVIPSVNLKADSLQKFALYLPAKFNSSHKYPVIIFFDPHAEGTLPLNLYSKLAEKYQYVLMASNTSKNGIDFQLANQLSINLVNEAITRFSADNARITLCGFSGGAKVALASGATNPQVNSIIYCGAATQFNPTHPVSLLGFAGKRDMNYTDVVSFDWSLKSIPFNHQLVEWNGKHEFPSAEIFKDAFDFLRSGKTENSKGKQVSITQAEIDQEQLQKQKYLDAFQSKDLNWWKEEIKSLNAKKNGNLMYERLLGFISLVCYSYTNNSIVNKDLQSAERVLIIYQLADPKNEAIQDFKKEMEKLRKEQMGRK